MNFLDTLENLGLSTWVRESPSKLAYPTILWLHVMGMGVVAGIGSVICLRLLGVSSKMPLRPLERLYPLMWWGFWVNATTGTALLLASASKRLIDPTFYVKMVFVIAGVVLLKVMRKKIFGDPQLDKGPVSSTAKGLAWLSLACWVGAITAGRLLAYLGPVSGIPGLTNR